MRPIFEDTESLREQLIQAKADITARLLDLRERAIGRSIRDWPPNFSDLIAELEGQLAEINALLGAEGGAEH